MHIRRMIPGLSPKVSDAATRLETTMQNGWKLVCGTVLSLLSATLVQAATPAGHWEGAIDIPGSKLEVVIDLAQVDQVWKGEIDIAVQSISNLPLEKFEVADKTATFSISQVPGEPTFHGALSNDGLTLSGRFTQGGAELSFSLRRTGDAQLGPPAKTATEKLAGFEAWVEKTRGLWNVPGVAVAIVYGDQTVLLKGFGSRDLDANQPVTPDTLFAIGSSTKAFTATLLGMLADEGRLTWDKPVREQLPEFELFDKTTNDTITPLDLLTHISGLPAHDLVWAGSPLDREQLFARLKYLEPTASLRQKWQYNNLMYMSAGMLGQHVSGKSWEQFLRERLLDPLGMKTANTSVSQLAQAEDRALGYSLTAPAKAGAARLPKVAPYVNLDAIGPCGAINASVREMVPWLRLQLSNGTLDGKKYLDPMTFKKLHAPVAVVGEDESFPEAPYVMYAPGWFIQPYRGHKVFHHGGNIDGFSSMVGVVPGERIGVVVLTNLSVTPLRDLVMWRAIDQLLELDPLPLSERYLAKQTAAEAAAASVKSTEGGEPKKGTKPSHELADYRGNYEHPAYGTIAIDLAGGKLQLSFHGMQAALNHVHYDVFKADAESPLAGTQVQFSTNLRGDVDTLSVRLEPSLAALDFKQGPPQELSNPEFLQRFVGDYQLEAQTIAISLRGDKLYMSIPGQPSYRLLPYRGSDFDLDGLSGYSARFMTTGDKVRGFKLIQPNGVFEVKRM